MLARFVWNENLTFDAVVNDLVRIGFKSLKSWV